MLYLTRKKPNKEIHCVVSERKYRLVVRAQEMLVQISGSARDFLCDLGRLAYCHTQMAGAPKLGERFPGELCSHSGTQMGA